MNGLSLLFFFPVIVSGIISVEKVQDKTILQIETYKIIQVDSDRATCACWSQCKIDSECTAVSIIPSSLGGTEASCFFTSVTSAEVKKQLQTESRAVTFVKDLLPVTKLGVPVVEPAVEPIVPVVEPIVEPVAPAVEPVVKTTQSVPQPVNWYDVPGAGNFGDCPYDVIKSDQTTKKFWLFTTCLKSFEESMEICTKAGGVLASLSDSETYGKIVTILDANYWTLGNIWVDVTKLSDNSYVWSDGISLPSQGSSPWHIGKPDFNEGCARLRSLLFKYGFDDTGCGRTFNFLCYV